MESKSQKLDVGEVYISGSLLGQIKFAAFKNKDKRKEADPDYTGNGVAIWINHKKQHTEITSNSLIL